MRSPIPAALALVLTLVPAVQLPAADAKPLRVMSFNIRYGTANDGDNAWPNRRELLFKTIEAFDPDLLGIQEALASQCDELRERMRGHAFVGTGRDDGKRKGEFSAILFRSDRFEKVDDGQFWLSETPEVPGSKGWDADIARIATWVRLRDRAAPQGTPPLLVMNTHFDHRGANARLESAKLIVRKLAELQPKGPVVLMGDLNTDEESAPYLHLVEQRAAGPRLMDGYRALHPERAKEEATFNGFKGTRVGNRIDYILHTPEFAAVEATIDRTAEGERYPSDHYPVTAVLRYNAAPPGDDARAESERASAVAIEEVDGRLKVTIGGEAVATYVPGGDATITRPYFIDLRAPGGVTVTRPYPPVEGEDDTDHAHLHAGAWVAFADIGGADPWRNRAKVVHQPGSTKTEIRDGVGSFTVANHYLAADGNRVIAEETCRYTFMARPQGHLMIVDAVYRPPAGGEPFAFGDEEEMGLAVRVATPIAEKNGGRLLDSERRAGAKEIWGKAADWCDYAGTLDGGVQAGITMMADPNNTRPTRWHARDYGMVAANPFGQKVFGDPEASRTEVRADAPLRLRYGLLLHAQVQDSAAYDPAAAYGDFVGVLEKLRRPD